MQSSTQVQNPNCFTSQCIRVAFIHKASSVSKTTADKVLNQFIPKGTFAPIFEVEQFGMGSQYSYTHFDAAVIYTKNAKELRFLQDQIGWYSAMPVCVHISPSNQGNNNSTLDEDIIEALEQKTQPMTVEEAQNGGLLKVLIDRCTDLYHQLLQGFQQYDKPGENQGKVNLKHLEKILASSGFKVDKVKTDVAMIELDKNCDGHIKFEELRKWLFSGQRNSSGLMGKFLRFKYHIMAKAKQFNKPVWDILKKAKDEQTQLSMVESKFTFQINDLPKDQPAKTEISALVTAYSQQSEQIFAKIIEQHPKLKPKNLLNSHHIWCLEMDANNMQTILTVDDLKPIAEHISKTLDIPVSVFANRDVISIALFWDSRKLGSAKFFDTQVYQLLREKEVDQSVKVNLKASFDMEELFKQDQNEDDANGQTEEQTADVGNQNAETIPVLLIGGLETTLETKLCKNFAPFFLDFLQEQAQELQKQENKNQARSSDSSESTDDLHIETAVPQKNQKNSTLTASSIPEYPFGTAFASLLSMAKMKGRMKLKFDQKQYDLLRKNIFVQIYDITGQQAFAKLTGSGGSAELIDDMATEMGLPADISATLEKLVSNSGRVMLSDNQTSIQIDMKSNGLHLLLRNIIRVISKSDKLDEAALW